MSGAEGIAGLAIGVIGLISLFTTCIDAFNIIITAQEFGQDYEVLCADLAIQRLRFCLWGEAVGLLSRTSIDRRVRAPGLDDPKIRQTLVQTLQAIQFLLKEADCFRDKLFLQPRSSHRLSLFRDTFNQFRLRADRNRRQASMGTIMRWAIYAGDKFQERIERLKSLIDGLEKVSEALGVLDYQRSRMQTEIESLDDAESLRLVRDASVNSQHGLSDTASHRLLVVSTGSVVKQASSSGTAQSFVTAEESQYSGTDQDRSDRVLSSEGALESCSHSHVTQNSRVMANVGNNAMRSRSWTTGPKTDMYGARLKAFELETMACFGTFPTSLSYVREMMLKLTEGENLWDEETSMTTRRNYKDYSKYQNNEHARV